MPGTKAKKRMGQHFLADKRVAARIVRSLKPRDGEYIVEIGPGKGALTEFLLEKGCRVTVIELDRDLIAVLQSRFGDEENIEIVSGDFLTIKADELPGRMKIIGNIPYNITTAILEKMFELKSSIESVVLTVQSEVAERVTAECGIRAYGSFTVIMAAGFDIKSLFNIPPKAFKPAPEIESTVIRLTPAAREPENFENFKSFVRGCFRQKRKTLPNSMQLGLNIPKTKCEALVDALGKGKNIRPEQLTFDEYVSLYRLWQD